jgi:hypothetical protein
MATERNPERSRRAADSNQEVLGANDAALSPELKQRYPIRSRQAIEDEYPNKWLAILPTRVDELNSTCEGRFLASARGRRALHEIIQPARAELPPQCYPFTYFNYRPKTAIAGSGSRQRRGEVRPAT